jgi:DDE superfamily endonuclease
VAHWRSGTWPPWQLCWRPLLALASSGGEALCAAPGCYGTPTRVCYGGRGPEPQRLPEDLQVPLQLRGLLRHGGHPAPDAREERAAGSAAQRRGVGRAAAGDGAACVGRRLILDVRLLYGVSAPTLYAIFWRVVDAVRASSIGAMPFPQQQQELERLAAGFAARSGPRAADQPVFSRCIGAVDGLLVETTAPNRNKAGPLQQAFFSGHKHRYGLNVLGMVDANLRFVAISVKCPGGASDITAWRKSEASHKLDALAVGARTGLPWYVLGDAAYVCSDRVLAQRLPSAARTCRAQRTPTTST